MLLEMNFVKGMMKKILIRLMVIRERVGVMMIFIVLGIILCSFFLMIDNN